jgi:hypothetical protein
MYLSLVGMKEAANRSGFGLTVGAKGRVRMLYRAASEVEISLLSNYPKTPALTALCAGRITVDAREKD